MPKSKANVCLEAKAILNLILLRESSVRNLYMSTESGKMLPCILDGKGTIFYFSSLDPCFLNFFQSIYPREIFFYTFLS